MKPDLADSVVTTPTPAIPVPAPAEPRAAARPAAAAQHPKFDYWFVVASHALVDVFPMFIISLMIVLSDTLALSRWQETAVWVATPIFSGLFQPLFAWLGDRYDTRLAGPVGLAVGAVCLGSIGFAQSFWQLIALQVVGVIGIGVYHPAAAAVAGQAGSRALRRGRAFALSLFVCAGMVGHTLGPIAATRINDWIGMAHLAWIIPPSILAAVIMHRVLRDAPHRPDNHRELRAGLSAAEARARWVAVGLVAGQNTLRFTVNTGMFILFNYWAAWRIAGDPGAAAILNGNLTAAMTIGMGVGALIGGRHFVPGTEKLAFAGTAFGGAACAALINVAGVWGLETLPGWLAMAPAYGAAMLTAIGFFSTVPVSVGLGQRLVPSHASLVTALLLGLGWAIAAGARPLSAALLGASSLQETAGLESGDFNRAFAGFAALLALAGVLALLMPGGTIRAAARQA